MPLLEGKVCIVTGGAGSIGLASARLFLREGAKVMLVDLDEAGLEAAVRPLDGGNVATVAADVGDASATRDYIERTVQKFGPSTSCSAMPATRARWCPSRTTQRMRSTIRSGCTCAGHFWPASTGSRRCASLIITSSVVGAMGAPGVVAYVTAKHAQVGLMRSVAKEAARRRIRVNTLHPGPVDNAFQARIEENIGRMAGGIDATRMLNEAIPLHRHATPEEIARSALYLASDLSCTVSVTPSAS
jgi:NAD(P)-dependent dehydrogenase (short-subunit alcohol dehydrogenase family)